MTRAQRDCKPRGIRGGVYWRYTDDRNHAGDVGILADRALDFSAQPLHFGK